MEDKPTLASSIPNKEGTSPYVLIIVFLSFCLVPWGGYQE